jgi:hypothetical protein
LLQYSSELKGKLLLELDTIIDDVDNKKIIADVDRRILEVFPPHVWNINQPNNMEVFMEVDFRKFLFSVSEHTNKDVEDLSVFDFYALIDHIKEKYPSGRSDS